MDQALSIIVPVYNEEAAIVETVKEILGVMDPSGISYELIIVNDGSKDNSRDNLEKFLSGNSTAEKCVRLLNHERNKGYGASLKTGIRNAAHDTIAITDADSTYPNKMIPALYEEYHKGFDMIVGKRSFNKLPMITRPAKWFISTLANFLVEDKIEDINSGLRIFRKEYAMDYFPIISNGFSFTTTITLAMFSNGHRVKYIPIEYFKREGKSKIRPIRDTLNFITLIIRTVMYFNPLKIFVPMSLFMFFLGFLFFGFGRFGILFKESPNDTITILFVGGLQILITGMIADLIDKRLTK